LEKTSGNLANDHDRAVSLFRKEAISTQERDKAVTAYEGTLEKVKAGGAEVERAEAAVVLAEAQTRDMAEAAVAQAEAALRQAKIALGEATIEAPIGGVVSMKYVDEGNMVGPTTPLVRIEDMDVVNVVGGLSERHLPALAEGSTSATVTIDAYAGLRFVGAVYRAGPGIDPLTRTVEVEIRIPNPEHKLKPGMFARLALILQRRENVPVVSDEAFLRAGEETFVYVVNNSKAHRCALKMGLAEGTRHEVLEGVKPGEFVVVRGQHMLKDGDPVVVVEEGKR
jgi:membrane fusion protein (multidrug efflux system)